MKGREGIIYHKVIHIRCQRFFCSSIKRSLHFHLTPRTHGWCSGGDNPSHGCCLALPHLVQRTRPSLLLQGALTLSKHSQSWVLQLQVGLRFYQGKAAVMEQLSQTGSGLSLLLTQLTHIGQPMQGLQTLEKPGPRKRSRHCELKSEL